MTNEHQEYAEWDAAYVLGALTPTDRHAFEEHLEVCGLCRKAVVELMSLPGLLAQMRPLEDHVPPPPVDLLDRMQKRERRRRMRSRLLLAGCAAAVVAAVTAVAVPAVLSVTSSPRGETVALRSVEESKPGMEVGLDPVHWGTRLSVTCDYPADQVWGDADGPWTYALSVTDSEGNAQQVSTWRAVPGGSFTFDAATEVPLGEIASLTVRTGSGEIVYAGSMGEASSPR